MLKFVGVDSCYIYVTVRTIERGITSTNLNEWEEIFQDFQQRREKLFYLAPNKFLIRMISIHHMWHLPKGFYHHLRCLCVERERRKGLHVCDYILIYGK